VSQNGPQTLGISKATAIQNGGGTIYVLDNEPTTYTPIGSTTPVTVPSQILAYSSIGAGGVLQTATGSPFPDVAANQDNPLFLLEESKLKFVYVANTGDNANPNNPQSGIAEYVVDTTTKELRENPGGPFGSGAGPQCLVEDPSSQFVYTANFNDSTVTGGFIDANSGLLRALPGSANKPYILPGPATYCLVDGRTS
jgi:hypothetical protein